MLGAIIGGLVFMTGLLTGRPAVDFLFGAMLFVGLVLISRLFRGFQSRERGTYLMMIPASTDEKFVLQWLVSFVGYYHFAILCVSLGGTLSILVNAFLYEFAAVGFIVPSGLWPSLQTFFLFHSIFFAGAILFKGNNFLKTCLVLLALAFVSMIGLGGYFGGHLMRQHGSGYHIQLRGLSELARFFGGSSEWMLTAWQLMLYLVIPCLLIAIAYYRFSNYQLTG